MLLRLAQVVGFDARQFTPHAVWQGCLSDVGPSSLYAC